MCGHLLSLSACVSFVIASWFEFKSEPSGKKLKLESVPFQVQHYTLDSLDNLWQPRRMGMGVISLSYIPWIPVPPLQGQLSYGQCPPLWLESHSRFTLRVGM